jgi:hypothetical protein
MFGGARRSSAAPAADWATRAAQPWPTRSSASRPRAGPGARPHSPTARGTGSRCRCSPPRRRSAARSARPAPARARGLCVARAGAWVAKRRASVLGSMTNTSSRLSTARRRASMPLSRCSTVRAMRWARASSRANQSDASKGLQAVGLGVARRWRGRADADEVHTMLRNMPCLLLVFIRMLASQPIRPPTTSQMMKFMVCPLENACCPAPDAQDLSAHSCVLAWPGPYASAHTHSCVPINVLSHSPSRSPAGRACHSP